jgi:hypothetical protein
MDMSGDSGIGPINCKTTVTPITGQPPRQTQNGGAKRRSTGKEEADVEEPGVTIMIFA